MFDIWPPAWLLVFPTTISSYTGDVWCQRQEKKQKTFAGSPTPRTSLVPLWQKLGQMPTSHLMTGMERGGSHCLLRPVLGHSFLKACGYWEERGQQWSFAGQSRRKRQLLWVGSLVLAGVIFFLSLFPFLPPPIPLSPSLLPSLSLPPSLSFSLSFFLTLSFKTKNCLYTFLLQLVVYLTNIPARSEPANMREIFTTALQ